ncbi:MAG: 30S ribosomal protein S6 [Candidatus Omnitrophica bacterium]|nr:30S ribosomal protein S6 [Candidatus Omnitrophota bacterium]
MKDYEGIFIAKASLTDEADKKLLALIEGEISKSGGKVENVEKWGKKTIAYPVKKNKEGVYYKLDFKITPDKISGLKKMYGLQEDILRVMIVKKG